MLTVSKLTENHVIVGELLEVKSAQQSDLNTPKSVATDVNWASDPEASQIAGGYSVGVSLTVLQVCPSECIYMNAVNLQLLNLIGFIMKTFMFRKYICKSFNSSFWNRVSANNSYVRFCAQHPRLRQQMLRRRRLDLQIKHLPKKKSEHLQILTHVLFQFILNEVCKSHILRPNHEKFFYFQHTF